MIGLDTISSTFNILWMIFGAIDLVIMLLNTQPFKNLSQVFKCMVLGRKEPKIRKEIRCYNYYNQDF